MIALKQTRASRSPRWWIWPFIGAAGAIAVYLLYTHDPSKPSGFPFPKCLLHQFTGWHCPGCGTTRATHQFLHGNIKEGLAYNPILGLALPLLALLFFETWARRRRRPSPNFTARMAPWILWVVLAYAILRNLPWMPFTLLAPN